MEDIKYNVLIGPSCEQSGYSERSLDEIRAGILAGEIVYEAILGEIVPVYDYDEWVAEGVELRDAHVAAYDKGITELKKVWGDSASIYSYTSSGLKSKGDKIGPFVSLRFIVRGVGKFASGADLKRSGRVPDMFDQSVYKAAGKRQLMRLWGASKVGEDRPMKMWFTGQWMKLEDVNTMGGDLAKGMLEYGLAQYVGREPLVEVKAGPEAKVSMSTDEGGAAVVLGANGLPLGQDILVTYESVRELCMLAGWFDEVDRDYIRWRNEMWLLQNTEDDYGLDLTDLLLEVSRACQNHTDKSVEDIRNVTRDRSQMVERKNLGQLRDEVRTTKQGYAEWAIKWKYEKKVEVAAGDKTKVAIQNLADSMLTDADVAEEMIKCGMVDDYLWLPDQGKHGTIMKWNGVIWETGSPNVMNSQISQTLHNMLEDYVLKNSNPEKPFPCLKKMKRLRTLGSINSIIGQICALKGSAEHIKWNMQEYKMAFANGVLDLKSGRFEVGCKSDFITQSTGYELPLTDGMNIDDLREIEGERINDVNMLFNQIMPDPAIRDVFWQILGSCLVGRTLEAIPVFTGVGRNGKGLTVQFLKNVLGPDFFYTGDNSVLQKEIGSGGINQSLANMGGKRCVMFSEGCADTRFKVSSLKNISGGDEINARGIYSSNTNTRLCATNIIDCNEIPPLDKSDAAIDARIKVIPFNSRFLTPQAIAKLPNGTKHVYPVNDSYKRDEWQHPRRCAMLILMLDGLRKMLDNPTRSFILYNIPKELEEAKRAYIQDSDEVLTWFKTHYHITNDEDDVVAIQDVYKKFKEDPDSPYANYTKVEKRDRGAKKPFIGQLSGHATLSVHYRKEIDVVRNSVRDHRSNVLIGVAVNIYGLEYDDDGKVVSTS